MNEEQQGLTFVPYTPAYRKAFFDLNAAWLNAYFLLEPFDIEVLSDPEKMVIERYSHVMHITSNVVGDVK